MKIKMPTVKEVAAELRAIKADRWFDAEGWVDVRLQVCKGGDWVVHSGDAQYDTDHTGFWGCSSLSSRSNCRDVARDLIDQCADEAAMCGE